MTKVMGLRVAPPDHRGNLIVGGLHSIPHGSGEAYSFTLASTSPTSGPVDRGPCPAGNPHVASGRATALRLYRPQDTLRNAVQKLKKSWETSIPPTTEAVGFLKEIL